jgi:actin related protein 2/3 complex subunit 1A/1B
MATKKQKIAKIVQSHAWSPDRSQLATCVEDNVVIYDCKSAKNPNKWTKLHVLEDHDMHVSSVDWSKDTNQIVTCSHDRNAFVWTLDEASGKWLPKLVILRIDRAANMVKWSPNGKKFAVASSAKKVPVCHFEPQQNWWISVMIKKHKSSVLCLDWHPNNQLIVTGACDFRCRVFCAFMEQVDGTQDNGPFAGKLEEDPDFAELICEFTAKGWVEAVAWSPSGNLLAYASHDSSLTIVDLGQDEVTNQTIKLQCLPLRDILFVSDTRILAVGYDFLPYVFDCNADGWYLEGDIDDEGEKEDKKKKKGAHSFWQHKTKTGQEKAEDKLRSKHDNPITCLKLKNANKTEATYSTTALDGRINEWIVDKSK